VSAASVAWEWQAHSGVSTGSDVAVRGRIVAKIIEFYIPTTFRKTGKWVPPKERGKIIEFVPETKKAG
jgi:hypothetical protein